MKYMSARELETMTTQDLQALAESLGLDIPADLDRRVIIAEIADAEETGGLQEVPEDAEEDAPPPALPKTYNNTCIDAVLVNPGCLFVLWDVNTNEIAEYLESPAFEGAYVHIAFFESRKAEASVDSLDIEIPLSPGEQYIMIPNKAPFVRVSLTAVLERRPIHTLCATRLIEIPLKPERIRNLPPGQTAAIPPLLELSGMSKALYDSFVNYRQSFS